MTNSEVSIIIINWNGLKFLNDCLSSIYNQTYQNFDVYFVDNGSVDGSVEFIKNNFPKTIIIQLEKNFGFAEANNIAIRKALNYKNTEYIVCLNNDTIVNNNWLSEMVKSIKFPGANNIGMVASKAYFPDGLIQNAGIEIMRNRRGRYIEAIARGGNVNDKINSLYNEEAFIFGPSGCSALYTRKMLEEVGLFDSDFFAFIEDIDLAMRGQAVGYKCIYNPNSMLIHFHSQTAKAGSPLKAYYSKRNTLYMAIKNFPFFELLLFPFNDIYWSLKNISERKNSMSVKNLKNKIGIFGIIKIMFMVYCNVLVNLPKFLIKRWKI